MDDSLSLRNLVEYAAFASGCSAHVIEAKSPPPDKALQVYWRAGRTRNDEWIQRLSVPSGNGSHQQVNTGKETWKRVQPLIEEVFVSEVLTRVWTAVLVASDRRQGIRYAEPIARSVLLGHSEARRCALDWMINAPHVSLNELAGLDRLRRRSERWTDALLGNLVARYDVGEFAFEPRRARDFAREQGNPAASDLAWKFAVAGIQLAFSGRSTQSVVLSQVQFQILRSVIACFPPDAFHKTGPFQSLANLRISRSGLLAERPPAGTGGATSPQALLVPKESPQRRESSLGISFRRLRRCEGG